MYQLMIVEDEQIIQDGLRRQIPWCALGFAIAAQCADGGEALAFLESVARVDAVLTDIKMPGMDGLQFIEALRNAQKNMPIVILSGYDDFAYARRAIRYDVFEYILKPSATEEIIRVFGRVREMLDQQASDTREMDAIRRGSALSVRARVSNLYSELLYADAARESALIHRLEQEGEAPEAHYLVLALHISGEGEHVPFVYLERAALASSRLTHFDLAACFHSGNGCMVFVLRAPADAALPLTAAQGAFEQLRATLEEKWVDIDANRVTGALSTPGQSLTQIKRLMLGALSISALRFVYGTGTLYTQRELDAHLRTLDALGFVPDHEAFVSELIALKEPARVQSAAGHIAAYLNRLKYICHRPGEALHHLSIIWDLLMSRLTARQIGHLHDMGIRPFEELFDIAENGTMNDAIEWFIYIAKALALSEDAQSVNRQQTAIDEAIDYMRQRLSQKLTLSEVSRQVFMSPTYFGIMLKRQTGDSFIKLLTGLRIDRAKALLRQDLKVYEAANMVGFEDYRHFSKVFLREVGMKPNEYKKNIQRR